MDPFLSPPALPSSRPWATLPKETHPKMPGGEAGRAGGSRGSPPSSPAPEVSLH